MNTVAKQKAPSATQVRAGQIAAIGQALDQLAEGSIKTVSEVAKSIEMDAELVLKLLNTAPLKSEVVLLFGKDIDSPVCLPAHLDACCQSRQLLMMVAERVSRARQQNGSELQKSEANFLSDAKLPKAVKPIFRAALQATKIAGDAELEKLIRLPPTPAQIARHLVETIFAQRGTHRYPMLKSQLSALANVKVPTTKITAAIKRPEFQSQVVECVTADGAAFAAREDVFSAESNLVFLAIEAAVAASKKSVGKRLAKPTTAFSAEKLASMLVKQAAARLAFSQALERLADDETLDENLAFLMHNGSKLFLRLQDLQPNRAHPSQLKGRSEGTLESLGNGPATSQSASPSSFAAEFDAAFERLDRQSGHRNYLKLIDLRNGLPGFDRDTFDSELRKLRLRDRYGLDSAHGGQVHLTDAERSAGIKEGNSLFVYVSRKAQ